MVECFGIDRSAEHGNDLLLKDQITIHQHQTAGDGQHDGAAHASAGLIRLVLSKAQADKGTAAVPDHHGDGQGDDGQGEHDCVGGVAVGAKIGGIGDKDLVNNVVKCPHQQRDNAGDCVFLHQSPRLLRCEKGLLHLVRGTIPPVSK